MGHSFTASYVHYVFATRNREPLIPQELSARLYAYIGGICRAERCSLIAAGGMPDHVHLLVHQHQSLSLADLMRVVKSRSTGWMHESIPAMSDFEWQKGYGGFTVSKRDVEAVQHYIEQQAEHHKHRSFQDEFLMLLERHGIEFDPRYVWSS